MVAEPWIVKMGSQVSTNLKQTLVLQPSKRNKKSPKTLDAIDEGKRRESQSIGILSFEVANVMSKTVYLYKSLSGTEISKLRSEISASEGVRTLVSADMDYLLELALAEKLDDLNRVAAVVARLGKRCSEPALQGFEHVYGDIVNGVIEVSALGFLVKDMDAMVRKMERYINATSNLYGEMEVLNELEQATKKFQNNQHEESKRAFEQKLAWQRQDVRHLREVSLWNQTYDKVVELLARTVCTVYARICAVFGEAGLAKDEAPPPPLNRSLSKSSGGAAAIKKGSSVRPRAAVDSRRSEFGVFRTEDLALPCGASPGRLFMECLSLSSSVSRFDDDECGSGGRGDYDERSSQVSACCSAATGGSRREPRYNSSFLSRSQIISANSGAAGNNHSARFGPKSQLVCHAPPTTVGGSALALHYANVIIVIEKLLRYPHLVGEEARDDLYQMLPTSLRLALRASLKSYAKDLAIYDAPLAHDWKDALDGVLKWLAPLAHSMIRWQSERNFEQQQIVARTNVLLLQTLYFADREKTEAAICRLLVGLNYICRYEHQQNALLDCASSFDFEDCLEWQLQCRSAYVD